MISPLAGWHLGMRGGFVAGLLSVPLHVLLYGLLGSGGSGLGGFVAGGGVPGTILIVAIATATGRLSDLSERVGAQSRELEYRVSHDPLTEQPNRSLFVERLERALSLPERPESGVAVLFVDLDNFKFVNDSLGHEAGDRLLVAVSRRLQSCAGPLDTVARLSGDEFAVLLENAASIEDAERVADRVLEKLATPFALGGQEVFVTASVGISFEDGAGKLPEDLLRAADVAMYKAKGEGKASYRVFDPEMEKGLKTRLKLEGDLRWALERDEFRVHYQPVVRLDNGELIGMEALARWEHPERGLLPPSEFIPLAEEVGLIGPIDQLVLHEACRQMKEWQELYPSDSFLVIGVNVSAKQLSHPEFLASTVESCLKTTGLDPRRLTLEITESALVEDKLRMDALRRLEGLGVRFALDDFGTGYSSLSYLRRLPAGLLKIDRSFLDKISYDSRDQIILSGVIDIASKLGLSVLAEGVETPEQLARVKALGCHLAQGFYFSKPLPAEEAEKLLSATLGVTRR